MHWLYEILTFSFVYLQIRSVGTGTYRAVKIISVQSCTPPIHGDVILKVTFELWRSSWSRRGQPEQWRSGAKNVRIKPPEVNLGPWRSP